MVASVVDDGTIIRLRGDRDHTVSRGYACAKGLAMPETLASPDRLLHPMRRRQDGTFERVSLGAAFDEIAERLSRICEAHGANAIALFNGTPANFSAVLMRMMADWLAAIGSPNKYSTFTIDQSAHTVTAGRMGTWDAGRHRLDDSDVALLVGCNPLVSLGAYGVLSTDPAKRLKASKARGLQLIVVDPRRSETAQMADCFLQPRPGEDVTILAGLIRLILTEGWHDVAFCDDHVAGVHAMREAVAPFDPAYVESRAGVPRADLVRAASLFARETRRGIAIIGTGAAMAPRSNLADHLAETLNALCGRYVRAGERVTHPGVLAPRRTFRAQASSPQRPWESSPRNRTGHGLIGGEFPSGVLADQILTPGPSRLRALIVNGGNPALCLPDQRRAVEALRALDLLVTIDPFMTATARLCHFVLPPKLMYERADILFNPGTEALLSDLPFGQYLPPIVAPPPGAEVIDDWRLYWELARRMGTDLSFAGKRLDLNLDVPPTTDELLAMMLRDSRVPFAELRRHPGGAVFDEPVQFAEPAEPGAFARLEIAPDDVIAELRTHLHDVADELFPYRLTVRRERDVMNSQPTLGARHGGRMRNAAYINPDDMAALGLNEYDRVVIDDGRDRIVAEVAPDVGLRPGVVSMAHCRGGLPDGPDDGALGVSTNRLVRTSRLEPINAMPVMTAVPVRLRAAAKDGLPL